MESPRPGIAEHCRIVADHTTIVSAELGLDPDAYAAITSDRTRSCAPFSASSAPFRRRR